MIPLFSEHKEFWVELSINTMRIKCQQYRKTIYISIEIEYFNACPNLLWSTHSRCVCVYVKRTHIFGIQIKCTGEQMDMEDG